MTLIAALLMFFALIAQRLGTIGTCTQGSDGPFLTGVELSSPMLLIISFLLLLTWRRRAPDWGVFVTPTELLGLVLLGGLSFVLLGLNYPIWHETLLAGGSPCGPDYASTISNSTDQSRAVLIGFVYGGWPGVLALVSLLELLLMIRFGSFIED